MLLTTKNKETKQHICLEQKRNRKTVRANRTIYTLIWYGFYAMTFDQEMDQAIFLQPRSPYWAIL